MWWCLPWFIIANHTQAACASQPLSATKLKKDQPKPLVLIRQNQHNGGEPERQGGGISLYYYSTPVVSSTTIGEHVTTRRNIERLLTAASNLVASQQPSNLDDAAKRVVSTACTIADELDKCPHPALIPAQRPTRRSPRRTKRRPIPERSGPKGSPSSALGGRGGSV